ncbi:MAG TPA: DUF6325 family protein [Acidimicrobiales bacterium]|nr:DUF6325 family protein [Acidimicrobiales bacterium]
MNGPDIHGPVDTLILEFPASAQGAATAQALRDLVDSDTIRLYDLLLVRRHDDGHCEELDLAAAPESAGALRSFAGARSGLLGLEDVEALAEVIKPGATAVAFVYENAWAIPFVAAARSEGAELVAATRITVEQIISALDAIESN